MKTTELELNANIDLSSQHLLYFVLFELNSFLLVLLLRAMTF